MSGTLTAYIFFKELSEECRKHWWLNLMYVQTLVEDGGTCVGVSWFLVDDMIFHWFSPLVFYPLFYAFKKTKRHLLSLCWWFFALLCFTFTVFYVAFTTKSPPDTAASTSIVGYAMEYSYHVPFYDAPWLRYQAYLIGIILGYFLHHTRNKEIKIGEITNILLWQMSFLCGFGVVYGLYDVRVAGHISLFDAMMYQTFHRIAWNGAVAWVIFSCVKGHGGIVNEFLSWSAFAPLSRLTFSAYLIHIQVLYMFVASSLSSFPSDYNWWTAVLYFLPTLMATMVVAFCLSLFFESPSIRVEKLLVEAILKIIIPSKPNGTITSKEVSKNKAIKPETIENDKILECEDH